MKQHDYFLTNNQSETTYWSNRSIFRNTNKFSHLKKRPSPPRRYKSKFSNVNKYFLLQVFIKNKLDFFLFNGIYINKFFFRNCINLVNIWIQDFINNNLVQWIILKWINMRIYCPQCNKGDNHRYCWFSENCTFEGGSLYTEVSRTSFKWIMGSEWSQESTSIAYWRCSTKCQRRQCM